MDKYLVICSDDANHHHCNNPQLVLFLSACVSFNVLIHCTCVLSLFTVHVYYSLYMCIIHCTCVLFTVHV